MAIVHVSEDEAVRDFTAVLNHVRSGAEVVIEGEGLPIAFLIPQAGTPEAPEPGYDEWFRAEIEHSLKSDPADALDEEQVESIFAERRRASLLRVEASRSEAELGAGRG